MRRHLVLISLGAALLGGATSAQQAVVLSETRQGGVGLSMYEEVSGRWLDSTAKSTAEGCTPNIGSRWADISAGPQGAVARWTLTPPADGLYEAQVTWGTSGNAIDARYQVTAGGQTTTRLVTQDGFGFSGPRNGNQWFSLGVFPGGPTSPVIIEVSDETVSGQPDRASSGRVYADAARLIPAGPGAVATQPSAAPPPTPAPAPAPAPAPPPAPVASPAPPAVSPLPPAAPAAATAIAWGNDYETALSRARSTDKAVLVNFVTERSRDARRMEAETWRDPQVIAAVNRGYVAVRISMERNQILCAEMGVYRSPTTLIVQPGPQGPEVVDRLVGFLAASELLQHLD